MREKLIQYVNLLFEGASNTEEIHQEILQNTLDRYDDLVSQGKTPEAAYRLAITGIGDINEILGSASVPSDPQTAAAAPADVAKAVVDEAQKRKTTAVAIAFYILCPFPLIILSEFGAPSSLGLLLMFLMIAAATALLIMNGKPKAEQEEETPVSPKKQLHKSVDTLIWSIGLAVYFLISFTTGAWFITWVIFPLIGSVQGLVHAILDLKEASNHEN